MSWTFAARLEEVPPGPAHIVELAGKEIGLFCVGDEYFAVLNHCPHAGAPVCRGRVTGMVTASGPGQLSYDHSRLVLRCPWHHWEFDLRSGEALSFIRARIKTYPVRVQDDELWIDL